MKTTKLFLMIALLMLISIGKVNAQAPFPYNIQLGGAGSYNLRGATGVYNTAIGDYVLSSGTSPVPSGTFSGGYNTGLGGWSLLSTTTGSSNCSIGYRSLMSNTTGGSNCAMGMDALKLNESGGSNNAIGYQALYKNTASANNAFGYGAGPNCTTGGNNVFIGTSSGTNLSTGSNNLILGSASLTAAASTSTLAGNDTSGSIILSNGIGNQRLFVHNNGYAGFDLGNNQIPQNKLEINASGAVAGTTGLKFRNFTNTNFTTTATSSKRVLTVNAAGDVILVDDIGGGITNSCTTNFIVPVGNASGNLSCSQIYDNGTSVGIGTTSGFGYNYVAGDDALGTVPLSGTARLKVNGVTWSGGFYASSDKKFKKEIKVIDNPLEAIQKLEGKTYLWNREANKDMNFDAGLHSGFIAQEIEKVLPHLVATDEKGNKAVNYTELIPYLVEAIKEQQTQINDLKNQISESFKTQNQDLIELKNTKIISVSPNPSNDVIAVSFNVEKSVQSAKLLVYDLNGNVINSLNINDRENNMTRTLQKDNFGKGIYIVTLVINGKSIDSKKIVFN